MTRRDDGFTLTELLVAITILGIIMVAIGAMIVTAFRTTSTVSDRLSASRGPKIVSRYWVPDAEGAVAVNPTGRVCGGGSQAVVTLGLADDPTPTGTAPADPGAGAPTRTVTWWQLDPATPTGRSQLVRKVCPAGSPTPDDTTVVVADLKGVPAFSETGTDGHQLVLSVTVPDKSEPGPDHEFVFSVAGYRQATA